MDKMDLGDTFLKSIEKFSQLSDSFKSFTALFDFKNLSIKDSDQIYNKLAIYLLDPRITVSVAECFSRDILRLVSSAMNIEESEKINHENHIRNCIVLSKLINVHPDVETFVIKYFEKYYSPFAAINASVTSAKKKRMECNQEYNIGDLEIVTMVYCFLKKSPAYFKLKWNWSEFIEKYGNHENDLVKWIYCQCIGIVTNLSEDTLKKFISTKLDQDTADRCSIEDLNSKSKKVDLNLIQIDDITEKQKISSVVNINGIYLPAIGEPITENQVKIVEVESTKHNLKKMALGILSNKGINLIGPIGSGKTVLVEYLAGKTGRILGENLIKIQLGDQTDSKLLLGTYRCTDIPGEFIWQPGVLTQAVMDGSWLLLEDIDSASFDIASLLYSLLENGYLTVPGYRDRVPIKHGFQLFVTQRLLPSFSSHQKYSTPATTLLEKQLLNINIEPLTLKELECIIKTLHPTLDTITNRIVNVFKHLTETLCSNISSFDRNSRYITTRDLFKWCSRAVIGYDVSSPVSGLKILQDAVDVFCSSYSSLEDRLKFAKLICSELGIVEEKVNYFFNQYKPIFSLTGNQLKSERVTLDIIDNTSERTTNFCYTRMASCLLERVMCCISSNEPVLLVGETGTGKTSTVQYLAKTLGQKLIVINMNQQSDSSDLFGGFKPTEMKFIIGPVKNEFENLFHSFYEATENKKFLGHINYCFNKERYSDLVKLMKVSSNAAIQKLNSNGEEKLKKGKKRKQSERKEGYSEMALKWNQFVIKLEKLEKQLKHKNALAFTFVEGSLVKAIENGYWVLLDEINLASAETLDCLSGLLEGKHSSISLLERGDKKPVKRHENFILFACMNPSTDVGKKNLPAGLRNRFTEFFVDELTDSNDLEKLVDSYLRGLQKNNRSISRFYTNIRKEAQKSLCDGLGYKPHFSLRSLCRALTIAAKNPCHNLQRSFHEAFCLSFLTQLDLESYKRVECMISKEISNSKLFGGAEEPIKSISKRPRLSLNEDGEHLEFEGYQITKGNLEPQVPENYILTPSVRKNLKDLTRIVSIGQLPVLLQGDTSVGKTSLITYLAKSSGNKCVRINNHEHTDLQEYIGSYIADVTGKLVFREGVLVEAMRKGDWIILDELNLAPSDVLEALNRVLDDNRELFIPETQVVVKAHQKFMLFATQNPPNTYGGRKMLSRAFRNRFVELHFNEIPAAELETILQQRCSLAPSYAKRIINVMKDLQTRRRGSAAFAGKHGFITLRDLFRWGDRYRLAEKPSKLYDWDQHLADEGYLVLAGKVRKKEEKLEIIDVLKKHLKRDVCPENLFTLSEKTSAVTRSILEQLYENKEKYSNIVWTYNMRQQAVLTMKALQFDEPVLIVGETGCGKTTVCDVIAVNNQQKLVTINCHMHTESSDFIGGLRPVRDHTEDINKLFEWVDGPLILAMREGSLFLTDEISLADDSVLERLNSLLEPERSLLLAEKGIDINNQSNSELVIAHPKFHFIGTMNPGGDYGKKELSPALRNRFTEVWSEPCCDRKDFIDVINHNIKTDVLNSYKVSFGELIIDFFEWFKKEEIAKQFSLTIRDVLTWVNFINACSKKISIKDLYLNGAYITVLDSIGSGLFNIEGREIIDDIKDKCKDFLEETLRKYNVMENVVNEVNDEGDNFQIGPFSIPIAIHDVPDVKFSFDVPTTYYNALRVVRGMQLSKPILLEGSPGVGKTSLVTALANATKNKLYRVNLSDQTDISDLFGADLPLEGGQSGQFSWKDGPLLQALKNGDWVLLDELNLASQSVLEGLNACLDHRGEIFIPELGKTFCVTPGTKFFACQNPIRQGGSRRGLPKSFLNRFTQVYIDALVNDDYVKILESQFPQLPKDLIEMMVEFNEKLIIELSKQPSANLGGPWEYNLRDLTRWCEIIIKNYEEATENKEYLPEKFVRLIYANRLRKEECREVICKIFEEVFGKRPEIECSSVYVTIPKVYIGDTSICRETSSCNSDSAEKFNDLLVLRSQMKILRDLTWCVNMNSLVIVVGSSGCGKSSIIRTLAGLTGKTLLTMPVTSAMDTSDLLGGFEQTDYTRHLEDLCKQTESLVNARIHSLLVSENESSALKLLKGLEKFRETSEEVRADRSMADETAHFIKKLKCLMLVWNEIEETPIPVDVKERVENLREKGENVLKSLNKEGSLNAGGKFEWVDSILIKSLINGYWLLVDNVNLCSAAVLDRLNGLLEPNGVLTISERGMDSNGKMVEITPHKDFRLFFTMDPKNGTISRAMRNRGIELYVLNDESTEALSKLDTKSLIYSNGIKDEKMIDNLIEIHETVSDLIRGDKPTTNHLLQSAFLISQQINRGVPTKDAVTSAVMDIYYKTRPDYEFNTNDPENVIKMNIDEILKKKKDRNKLEDVFGPNCTLDVSDINLNSSLSQIKQQVSAYDKYLMTPNILTQKLDLLLHFLNHFYSVTSAGDLKLRYYFFKKHIEDHPKVKTLQQLNELCYKTVGKITWLNSDVLPLDERWISNSKSNNNGFLVLYFLTLKYSMEYNRVKQKEIKTKKEVTILQYITKIKQNVYADKIGDAVIKGIVPLLKQFDDYLIKNFTTNENIKITDDQCIQIISCLQWRTYIYTQLQKNINDIKEMKLKDILSQLHVHYKWFVKYSIEKIINSLKTVENKNITKIVNRINSSLTTQFSVFQKIGKHYKKSLASPPPVVCETQLDIIRKYDKITEIFNFYKTSCEFEKIISILLGNKNIYPKLCTIKYKLQLEDLEEFKYLLDETSEKYVHTESDIHFIMVTDYFALLNIYKGRVNNEREPLNVITIPNNLNGILRRYKETNDRRLLHEIDSVTTYYLLNALCTTPRKLSDDNRNVKLNQFSPILTYLLTNFLINENCTIEVKFGDYQNSYSLYNKLNVIVWNYFEDISGGSYDFIKLEHTHIITSFEKFLEDFTKSLGITTTTTTNHKAIINSCVDAIRKTYIEKQSQVDEDGKMLIEILHECSENIDKLGASNDSVVNLNTTANSYVYLNYLKALLNSKLSPIDPVLKQKLKQEYLKQEINLFENVKSSYEYQYEIYTIDVFPLCPVLSQKIDELEEKYEEIKGNVAYRPKIQKYTNILQDVQHAFSTILSSKNILEYLTKINNSIGTLHTALVSSTNSDIKDQGLLKATGVSSNIERFCELLSKYRSSYPDIIEPLYSNLIELVYGIRIKECLVKKLIMQYDNHRKGLNIDMVLTKLVSFPNLNVEQQNCLQITNLYLNENLQSYIKQISLRNDSNAIQLFRYIKCALLEIYNFALVTSKYPLINDINLVKHFEDLVKKFISIWKKQQETIEKEQLDSQSLYKFKAVNYSEEEEIQKEFEELFPTFYDEDFNEFQQHSLDHVNKETPLKTKGGLMKLEDVNYVYDLHKKFIGIYTKTTHIKPNDLEDNFDHIAPLMEKYKLFKLLLENCVNSLDYNLDKELLSSLVVLVNVAKNFGNITSGCGILKDTYNFYRDPNIDEVKNCYHILKELEQEINRHLDNWPDHPTLQNIKTIITRLYNFDIKSPLSRFLTGFEILLTKCHEWEQNAHSGVSLQTSISSVAEQIISWRKLELNMWKNSLNITFERMNLPIARWWCYLHNVTDQFENEFTSQRDLIDTIQKFVMQSNLAEFENRLGLLKLYHCQCLHLNKSGTLQNILWNIYKYYLQFLPNVTLKIKDLRSPIEKKLKDYVKIVRWKDISYWAVKDTLVKTHKIIHKHMKDFEKILQRPVQPFLVLPPEKHGLHEGIWDQTNNDSTIHDYSIYISKMQKINGDQEGFFEESLLGKSEKYLQKSKSLTQKIISTTRYPKLIRTLEEFLSIVLETSFHLQRLEIDKILSPSKQKSQARSILQQKRRALSDLFKALSKMGLSYKTGILESNLEEDLKRFTLSPIDIELLQINMVDSSNICVNENILKSWCGSEAHYLKSLIRLDVLQNLLLKPSKDLGVPEIERCKGFPINLMNNIFNQKEKLITSASDFQQLSFHTAYFKQFCDTEHFVETNNLNSLTEALRKTIIIVEEYKIILNTCPDRNDFETDLNDIPLLKNKNGLCYKNEEIWSEIFLLLNNALDKIDAVLLTNITKGVKIKNIDFQYTPIKNLNDLEKSIEGIEEVLEKLLKCFGNIPLSNSLRWIKNEIFENRINIKLRNTSENQGNHIEKFKKLNEELFSNILLSIQSLFKNLENGNLDDSTEENEQDILKENHLNILTKEGIFTSISSLNTQKTLKIVYEINTYLQKSFFTNNRAIFKEILNNTLPLLDQFQLLFQFFFTQQIASYRISSKTNSILLNIFTDLITKGFCIPPEFSEELSQEGSSQQSSGMGLGDGEGEKDVSDKIESEDQLDDAKPDGESNQQDEDKDCKEEAGGIEMSEDFDSKLQDVEEKEDDENQDGNNSDADEQMGDTEAGADQLDEEIWGSDDEEEKNKDSKDDEKGSGGKNLNEEQIGAGEDESKEKESDGKKPQDVPLDKELNEEYDDEQIDPYHQNQHEVEEPEAMDLPDDLQLEDGDDKEEENQEENPFDIDEMKDKLPEVNNEEKPLEEKTDDKEENEQENGDDDDGDENNPEIQNVEQSGDQNGDEIEEKKDEEEKFTSDGLDERNSKSEEAQQPMDVDNNDWNQSRDKIATNDANKGQNNQDSTDTTQQENENDSEGQGQCQNDQSEGGHRDTSVSHQMSNTNQERNIEDSKKMGESDSKRSLGDISEPVKKKLKTVNADNKNDDQDMNPDDQNRDSDMYQHIKESKKYKDQVLDVATKEQVEEQKIVHDENRDDLNRDNPEPDLPNENNSDTEEINILDTHKEKSETINNDKKSSDRKTQHPEGDIIQEIENVEVEGELAQTLQVSRGNESYFNQNIFNTPSRLSQWDLLDLRQEIEHQLSTWAQIPTDETAQRTWDKISAVTSSLAYDLAEQLRLVLEPTQASRLKGDFKTGKRINMRKIIAYIASQFRKDKIWLRRTKPAKREYQIVLAIDDSSSMADNHSKELAFESLALISRALTLLESGDLSILSFGENTEVLHKLGDPFTERNGAKLLQKFQFAEEKTCVGQMVLFATEMLNSVMTKINVLNAKLLVIVSDGRGIFFEGETFVHDAIRRARLSNVFTIFIIIDNPDNNSSILDIRRAVFKSDNSIDVQSYMDTFPFPFYIVLRDINSLPSVLSDALRQWFEMVSNADK